MQIFLARNNVQAGPYTLEQLNSMLSSGEVLPDDLIWHEGMDNWQKVATVVGDKPYYTPPNQVSPLTVDKLYGNNTAPNKHDEKIKPALEKKNKIVLGKAAQTTSKPLSKMAQANKDKANDVIVAGNPSVALAPVMTRVLALAINGVLYLLAILPVLLELAKLDIDEKKLQNVAAAYEYSMTIVNSIPDVTIMASQLMVLALFAIQLLLIIKRGQSLGKMITGIRVVDEQTHRLPSFGRLFGMRTLLLLLIYHLLFVFTSILGFLAIAVHFFMVAKSSKNIGWHDKKA